MSSLQLLKTLNSSNIHRLGLYFALRPSISCRSYSILTPISSILFKTNTNMRNRVVGKVYYNTEVKENENVNKKSDKKQSKFNMFYKQYGPSFLVIHLATVVAWIYLFFIVSKQGYDITQLLVLFEKIGLMSNETVTSIHGKIDNYKPEKLKGYITGADIKHFVTAYMVYKVIAPFRYMVSIALTRTIVLKLRSLGIFKS